MMPTVNQYNRAKSTNYIGWSVSVKNAGELDICAFEVFTVDEDGEILVAVRDGLVST